MAKGNAPRTTASLSFEAKPWLAANKLRNNTDAAEYRQVVLRVIFPRYILILVPRLPVVDPFTQLTAASITRLSGGEEQSRTLATLTAWGSLSLRNPRVFCTMLNQLNLSEKPMEAYWEEERRKPVPYDSCHASPLVVASQAHAEIPTILSD